MDILTALGNEANGDGNFSFDFGITEMAINGQLTYGDMVKRKIHWQTANKEEPEAYEPIDFKSSVPFYLGP